MAALWSAQLAVRARALLIKTRNRQQPVPTALPPSTLEATSSVSLTSGVMCLPHAVPICLT